MSVTTLSLEDLGDTLWDAAHRGEDLGMDRHLRSGTSKRRTHSLFRQGCILYELIPNMPEVRLRPLVQRFAEVMQRSSAIHSLVAIS